MDQPPRPHGEGVITGQMWAGIFFVGAVMAAGTLLVLDASLPGGLIEGSGDLRYAQTMAFTTLMMFQLFNVFNARSDERSAFEGLFTNHWLWAAIGFSVVAPRNRSLPSVSAAGVLDDGLEPQRLALLHGGREFGAVAARTKQGRHTRKRKIATRRTARSLFLTVLWCAASSRRYPLGRPPDRRRQI